jgi:hypothetical protein
MKYVVLELQTNSDGTVGNLVTAHDTRNAAESAYHSVLAAAAISALPKHAAVLLTSEGTLLDSRCYEH